MSRGFLTRYRVVLAAALSSLCVSTAMSQGGGQSVWDGVYTSEQAQRGGALADEQCVACHGDRLSGGESAPPLTGDLFNANWEGVTLSDLSDRIRTTMPLDRPASLSRARTADLLAYMLQVGGFPAGSAPLGADAGALGRIRFESNRPQR